MGFHFAKPRQSSPRAAIYEVHYHLLHGVIFNSRYSLCPQAAYNLRGSVVISSILLARDGTAINVWWYLVISISPLFVMLCLAQTASFHTATAIV